MFDYDGQIVDLTHHLNSEMPVWPTLPPFRFDRTGTVEKDGSTMEEIGLATHTGTHVDLPLHFVEDGESIEGYNLERFMGEGIVVDVSGVEAGSPIRPENIEQYLKDVQEDDVLFFHTGWDEFYGSTTEYIFEYPYLSSKTAEIVANLDLAAVGTDALSVAGWNGDLPKHGPTTATPPEEIHLPFLEREILIVEELTNLDKVLQEDSFRRAEFFFPPLNICGAGGAPVRAFAFI